MCGRFAFYSPAEATAALFGARATVELKPRYNIAPTQDIAAIRRDASDGNEFVMLRWGLVPFWAKDPSIGNRMINARAETVREKPSFRDAYRKRRCLILADGFYEWHTEGGVKTPWFISRDDAAPLAFAGLWENWVDKATGESLQTGAIITTEANEFMSGLHHRMPVILEPELTDSWLGGDMGLLDSIPSHYPRMRAWPVDRKVNNARNEGAELIEPVGEAL